MTTKADIEFYNSGLVLKIARTINPNYDNLKHYSKIKILNKSVDIIYEILNYEKSISKDR